MTNYTHDVTAPRCTGCNTAIAPGRNQPCKCTRKITANFCGRDPNVPCDRDFNCDDCGDYRPQLRYSASWTWAATGDVLAGEAPSLEAAVRLLAGQPGRVTDTMTGVVTEINQ